MPVASLSTDFAMHYEDDDFTDPWREAETVILHHGIAKNGRLWYAWVPLLAREYRVIRLDARGFGESSVPAPGYRWSLEGFAEDVLHLMDHLNIEKAHFVGESGGGTIGLVFAHRYPQRLSTVTASGSPYKFRGDPQFGKWHDEVKNLGVEAWVRSLFDMGDQAHTEWYVQQMTKTPRHVILETLTAFSEVDLTERLRQITTPVLIMEGAGDAVRLERRTRMAELFPNGRLGVVQGSGGRAHHAAPAQSVAVWRDFVKAVTDPR